MTGTVRVKLSPDLEAAFPFTDEEILAEDGTLKISGGSPGLAMVCIWMNIGEVDTVNGYYEALLTPKTTLKLKRLSTLSNSTVK